MKDLAVSSLFYSFILSSILTRKLFTLFTKESERLAAPVRLFLIRLFSQSLLYTFVFLFTLLSYLSACTILNELPRNDHVLIIKAPNNIINCGTPCHLQTLVNQRLVSQRIVCFPTFLFFLSATTCLRNDWLHNSRQFCVITPVIMCILSHSTPKHTTGQLDYFTLKKNISSTNYFFKYFLCFVASLFFNLTRVPLL